MANEERAFPDITLPSILPLPPPPQTQEEAIRYLKTLHHVLSDQQAKLIRSLNILQMYSVFMQPTEELPLAIGSGRINIDPVSGQAVFDAPIGVDYTLSESDIKALAEWKPLTMDVSFVEGLRVREPVVVGLVPPVITLGDDVVIRETPPATTETEMNQVSSFVFTLEGDIVMGEIELTGVGVP